MARPSHYVPAIDRFLVKVLFHEARHRGIPMTRLVDQVLRDALSGGTGWRLAEEESGGGVYNTAKTSKPTNTADREAA